MNYTIRVREDEAWLDLLNEKGDVEEFYAFSAAVIRGKALVEKGQVDEAEIRSDRPMLLIKMGFEGLKTEWLI